MKPLQGTRLAILGTMAGLHHEPVPYNLAALRHLLIDLAPDILCAEITTEKWETGDLNSAEIEVREVLAPVAAVTDTVLVPIAPTLKQFMDFAPQAGWRGGLVRALDRFLRWGQRKAGTPEAINGPLFGAFCHTLCGMIKTLWMKEARAAWEAQNRSIAENIARAIHRDPGGRVLVIVQCHRLHQLLPLLRTLGDDYEITSYKNL